MTAAVRHDTSGLGLKKFQAAWFLLYRVYHLIRGSPGLLERS